MSDLDIYAARRVAFGLILVAGLAALGYFGYQSFTGTNDQPVSEDSRAIAQIQAQLSNIQNRLDDLEKARRVDSGRARNTDSVKSPTETDTERQQAASPAATLRPARMQYQVSPPSAAQAEPAATAPPAPDPAQAKALTGLQQGLGNLQQEANSNRDAWQATANRLADVAGELGSQDGKIIQDQAQLNQFLVRAERTPLSFELRRGSAPEPVGPVRLVLQASNEKSRRYTLCVYLQDSCVQVRDRAEYEVVQLAVSPDTAPVELIATKVGKDGIVGYLEVARANGSH